MTKWQFLFNYENSRKGPIFKVFCYHSNRSTILLLNSIFRATPEVSSKLYFVEIS